MQQIRQKKIAPKYISIAAWGFVFSAAVCFGDACFAQLFGERQVGLPISRQGGARGFNNSGVQNPFGAGLNPFGAVPGQQGQPGMLQGGERFIRGSRGVNQFVGADMGDTANFVGQINAGPQNADAQPAVAPVVRPNMAPLVNRPIRSRSPNSPMEPQLEVAFRLAPETISRLDAEAQTSIDQSLSSRFGTRISASVEGPKAILRGEVLDEEHAKLAELMSLMEPGISQVENQIQSPKR